MKTIVAPLLALVLAGPFAAPAAGQKDQGQSRTYVTGPGEVFSIVTNRRPRLGVTVNLRARETDSMGAYVDGVTPGGPADQAGIRSGDVITRIGGTSLAGTKGGMEGRSLPGLKLVELAARLEPNDTVEVQLRRGNGWKEKKTVRVVTGEEPGGGVATLLPTPRSRGLAFQWNPAEPGLQAADVERMAGGGPWVSMFIDSPLGQLELAPLNPELGRYFGTDDGVLVIAAPKDSKLGLQGGDVVLAIDGRKPSSPSHLLRILRSYDAGESFKLDVMRDHHRRTVTASLDGTGGRARRR